MGIQTHLGVQLAGTVKNNNGNIVASNTPSVSYLIPNAASTGANSGGYRNTGAGDAYQFLAVSNATLTGIAAASFPYTYIPYYTVGGVNYPIVIPAGAYFDNINLDVTTAFTYGGTPTGFTIAVQLVGAAGTTYATAQTIATFGASASVTAGTAIGRYVAGNSGSTVSATNPIVYTASATPLAALSNTGNTDTLVQLVLTFTGGTTPTITAGGLLFGFDYTVRNPDGSWYPQTPPYPLGTTPAATY